MALQHEPTVAERDRVDNIQLVQGTPVIVTTSITNTATTATQATGLSITLPKIGSLVKYLKVCLSAEYITNSAAVDQTIALWVGTVGTGTQLATSITTVATGGNKSACDIQWIIPVGGSNTILTGTAPVLNIDLHGSGAGTNTIAAATTAPIQFWIEEM